MIRIKTAAEIKQMRKACVLSAKALKLGGEMCQPGMSTGKIDKEIYKFITKNSAYPTFLGYNGFPASACISLNDEVIHGIPSSYRILSEGDIVKIDVGAKCGGFNGDCANTFYCGDPANMPANVKKLIDITRASFFEGMGGAASGKRVGDIGSLIQRFAETHGFSVVREYTGHGIGRDLHEPPEVPNFGRPGRGVRLTPGMTIAVEPMLNAGTYEVIKRSDGWTVTTADNSLSGHYENTILILEDGYEILTIADE